MSKEVEILKRKLKREFDARNQAELLLEEKAAELYETNQNLLKLNANLEKEITKRTRLISQEYARLKTLINSLNGGIILEDKDRKIALINDNFCQLFSVKQSPEELIGRDIDESIFQIKSKLLKPARFEKYINKILELKHPVFNVKLKLKDGITLQCDYIPVYFESEFAGHMWHYRDISKQQSFQMDLIAARNAEKHFLSNMSHEIRTPINSIIGMSKLLEKEQLNDTQKKYVDGIITSSQHLMHILNHILDFNKIRSGKIVLEENDFDLSKILSSVIDSLKYKAEEKSINFTANIDTGVFKILYGDSGKLQQVLVNLVGNSLKFTNYGFIKINCSLKSKKANYQTLLFEVIDSGIGIKKENHKKIFESFTQESISISKKFGGTGLGLTISKEIIALMGGEIKLESEMNKGSNFYFKITVKNGDPDKITREPQKIDNEILKGKTILVAEDYAPNRFILQTFLKGWNAQFVMTTNGEEAVNYFKTGTADLILMDVQMPEMNGLEATLKIRKMGIKIPIIGLSATVVKEVIESGMKNGMDDYLPKPFEPQVLFSKIVKNLGLEQLPEEENKPNKIEQTQQKENLYNFGALLNMVGGNEEKAAELIKIFIENTELDVEEINKCWNTKDYNQLSMIFHRMKGSVRMLNINDLADLLAKGELMAKQDSANPELEDCVNQAVDVLRHAILQIKNDKILQ